MEPKKIWTAAELDDMSPAERQKIFDDSIVWDLNEVPTEFLDRIRAKVLAREASQDVAELQPAGPSPQFGLPLSSNETAPPILISEFPWTYRPTSTRPRY